MKPPFAYYGGKTLLAERIVSLFPAHRHYVEPFAGSLAVLLAKQPARHETVNDIDGELVTFWRVLRDRPAELLRRCALTPHARAEHRATRTPDPDEDEVTTAWRVWVALSQGRAGTMSLTGWRHFIDPAGAPSGSMPGYLDGYVHRMPPAARRLRSVSLECRPAVDMVRRYGQHDGVLIYADPPYVASTCTSHQSYRHAMTDAEHRDLADALHACRAAVVLSGYPSALYDELYADWHRVEIAAWTGQGGRKGDRTEVLWTNRPLEQHLFAEGAAG